jgi:hypothetical protein
MQVFLKLLGLKDVNLVFIQKIYLDGLTQNK